MNKYVISVRNTFTGKYEEVEVSREVYEVYRRAEWTDENDRRRFYKHQVPFSCLIGNTDDNFENFHEFVAISLAQDDEEFTDDDISEMVHNALRSLSEAEFKLITELFFEGKTEKEIATLSNVSQQAIAKRKKRILMKLRIEISEKIFR